MVWRLLEPRADEEFNRKHNKVAFGTGVPAINRLCRERHIQTAP
jgi:hypothetical protein